MHGGREQYKNLARVNQYPRLPFPGTWGPHVARDSAQFQEAPVKRLRRGHFNTDEDACSKFSDRDGRYHAVQNSASNVRGTNGNRHFSENR